MKRTIGALAALALLSTTAAWAATDSHLGPQSVSIDGKHPEQRILPNFDRSAEKPSHRTLEKATPRFIWNQPDPKNPGRSFQNLLPSIAANVQLSSLARAVGAKDVRTLGLTYASSSTNALGQRFIRYEQRVGGIEVFRSGATALLDRENKLVALNHRLASQAFGSGKVDERAFELSAREAVAIGYDDMVGAPIDPGLFRPAPSENGYLRFGNVSIVARKTPFLSSPARAKKVFFPSELGLIPAWYVEVVAQQPQSVSAEAYAYVVAAHGRDDRVRKGELLMRRNLVADADLTFRVWADTTPPYTPMDGPTGSDATPYPLPAFDPNAPFQSSNVAQNVVTLPNGVTAPGRDPWFEPADDFSYSNHAFAYADLFAPDGFTDGDVFLPMNVTGGQGFDYAWDENLGPDESLPQVQAAISQLLYTNHWLHDFFYEAGFDEVSGNAQWTNFGRGGLEGDAIHAQAQDFNGTNNANMATPADGSSPVMQMFLFDPIRTQTLEVLQPAGLQVNSSGSDLGPQIYDHALEVVDGDPDPVTCTFANEAALAGKAVIIPWWEVEGCTVQQLLARVGNVGGALTLLDYAYPPAPDAAPYVIGPESLSAVPVIVVSTNGAQALRDAAADGTVEVHVTRTKEVMVDGTLDNAIIAHEWGHYLTHRLIGNASGLGNTQGDSMGEGWGDFVALLLTVREQDASRPSNTNWSGAFPASTYAPRGLMGAWADYFGIRRVPYSTDLTKNALTFRHIEDGAALPLHTGMLDFGNSNAEVHNAGEIWATALWEAYASLLRAHPFQEAQNRMKNYLVAGLKLTPVQPTFTEARDALLAAADANDPADFQRFVTAFAKRGMGSGAVSPDRYSDDLAGVVENFEIAGRLDVLESELVEAPGMCDEDGILDSGEEGLLRLTISNQGWGHADVGTVSVTSSTPGLTILTPSVPVSALNRHGVEEIEVGVSFEGATGPTIVTFEVTAGETGASTQTHTELSFHANYDWGFSSNETLAVPYEELNWTHEHDPALGNYAFGLNSFDGSFGSIGFHGINPSVQADYSLVSPVLEVGQDPLVFSFDHFHVFDFEVYEEVLYVYDGGVIEISVNGGVWADIGDAIVSGPAYNAVLPANVGNPLGGRPAFTYAHQGYPDLATTTVDLGTAYAGQNVRVRFRIGSDESFGQTGWYIDAIRFSGITNTPFAERLPDQSVCGINQPPTVDAGEAFTVEERSIGTLGATVSDPNGLELVTVTWTQVAGPTTTLDSPDAATTTFTAPEVTADTQATFKVTVTDGVSTVEDSVVVTILDVNRAPNADAGADVNVNEREVSQLAGSGTDPDGDAVTFAWTQVNGPAITLDSPTAATTTFTAPEVTANSTATLKLTVSDGVLSSEDTVVVTITDVNRAPVAEAGPSVTINEREPGELQGSGTDPDGDTLTYAWTQVDGPATTLTTPDAATTGFLAPEVTADTAATFKLTVSDGDRTGEDTVVVTIVNVNRTPVADAGANINVNEREGGQLQGSGTDPDGDALTYAWTQVDGPAVTLNTPSAATTTFTAPEVTVDATATFKLTVSDGTLSGEDTVVATIVNVNRAPIADAGEAQTVRQGDVVSLTGAGVDPDGDVLTFAWSQVSGETVTLDGAATSTPSFTAPEVTEDTALVFALVVSDGALSSEPSQVTVTVASNKVPVISLIGDSNLTGDEGTQLTVAVEATDADGDEVSVTWSQVSGPSATLEGADTAEVIVTLPSIEQATAEIVLQAVPNDGFVDGAPVTVTIVVTDTDGGAQDGAPVVTAANATPTRAGANARLEAQGTDPQGGTLTYVWEQVAGPEAVLTPDGKVLWVRTPHIDKAIVLEFKVTATSSVSGLSSSATATVPVIVHQGGGCGGCSSAGTGTLLPAGLAFLAFALRRRRLKV